MGLFGTKKVEEKETTIKDCVRMIEGFLKKHRFNPNDQRLKNSDTLGWWIQRGSAIIYILLNQHDQEPTVRILSPLLYLPEEHILAFYRRCLELNMNLINCAFGALDDQIALVTERPIVGLDAQELEGTLHYLSAVADDVDDKLAAEFHARMYVTGRVG